MSEERYIRINKVLREFNISLDFAVDYLKDKGIVISSNPNTKISQDEYNILFKQFAGHKDNKATALEISEEKRKEKEALRLEKEKEDKLIEKPKTAKIIKLDLYNNLNKDVYDDVLSFLNTLSIDFFELKVNLINTETKEVVVEKVSKINELVKGFANLKKSSNLLTYANTNTIFALCANELEVNFYGGSFPSLSKKVIGSIIYQFKESNFFFNNWYNFPENIDEYVLSLLISKFTPYQCLALLIVSNKLKAGNIEKLKKKYTISEITKKEFNEKNPFEKDILETLKEDYANGIILKKISFENDFLESEFTDFQAFQICRGIKNKEHLYNKFDFNKHDDKDVFEAHSIAMKLLKDKGKNIINFILSIPPLPFKCDNFKILFSSLDKRRNQNENPVVRLKIKNHENATEEIEYSFLMEENTKYINQIRVRNKTTNTELFDVNRDGIVIPKGNIRENGINKNITPILQLFYRITENETGLKKAIISYGIETGQCSICGRTLTDNSSKMKGIGPICEQYV